MECGYLMDRRIWKDNIKMVTKKIDYKKLKTKLRGFIVVVVIIIIIIINVQTR
jgi:hypothetical protein